LLASSCRATCTPAHPAQVQVQRPPCAPWRSGSTSSRVPPRRAPSRADPRRRRPRLTTGAFNVAASSTSAWRPITRAPAATGAAANRTAPRCATPATTSNCWTSSRPAQPTPPPPRHRLIERACSRAAVALVATLRRPRRLLLRSALVRTLSKNSHNELKATDLICCACAELA
jgi:hypothetical protein